MKVTIDAEVTAKDFSGTTKDIPVDIACRVIERHLKLTQPSGSHVSNGGSAFWLTFSGVEVSAGVVQEEPK